MNSKQLGIIIVIALGIVAVIGVVGLIVLTALGKPIPEVLSILLSTVAGGLLGIVNPRSTVNQGESPVSNQVVDPL